MGPPSQAESNEQVQILEGQIRECFGRVVYSHKTHEKCADIFLRRLAHLKTWQIGISAVVTGSLLVNIFGQVPWVTAVGGLLSGVLLFLNTYFKNYDLGQLAEKHKEAADKLWCVRETYFSLLTDISALRLEPTEIVKRRDELQTELSAIYKGAPKTTSSAYKKAQQALKVDEDLTFSDKEIDAFLPAELKRENRKAKQLSQLPIQQKPDSHSP